MNMVVRKWKVVWAQTVVLTGLLLLPPVIQAQTSTNRLAVDGTQPDLTSETDNTGNSDTTDPSISTQPALTDAARPGRVVPTEEPTKDALSVDVRPEQNDLTQEIKEQIELLQRQKEAFIKWREEYYRNVYKNATEEERQKIRERMKELIKRWREISKERIMEPDLRQRAIEAKLEAHKELIEQAREKAQEQVLEKSRDLRRGQD